MSTENMRYYTKDTVVASWLYMNGITMERIVGSKEDAQIVFIGARDIIEHLIEDYKSGNPHGNIITFFRSYKDILAQIKER